jgi:hypothetical protein
MKPTVIGTKAAAIQPTAMPAQGRAAAAAASTVLASPTDQGMVAGVTRIPGAEQQAIIRAKAAAVAPTAIPGEAGPASAAAPTALPAGSPTKAEHATPGVSRVKGVERRSIAIDRSWLAQQYPGYASEVLEQAVIELSTVAPDVFNESDCVKFGLKAQKRYSKSVERLLDLLDSDSLRNAPHHLERLQTLLQDVGEALADGGISWLKRESARQRLERVRGEVDQLRRLLEGCADDLMGARTHLQGLARESGVIEKEATGLMLACEVLANRLGEDRARVLLDRGISLGKTAALLQEQRMQIAASDRDLGVLVARIHDGVLISLPAWMSTVLAAPNDKLNDTQRYLLRDGLAEVINKLENR